MTDLHFDGFDWNEGNITKSFIKHGVSVKAVETLLLGDVFITDDTRHSSHERRYIAIGRTERGRWMLVSFTYRAWAGKMLIRPISSRYMHKKEVGYYEQARKKRG